MFTKHFNQGFKWLCFAFESMKLFFIVFHKHFFYVISNLIYILVFKTLIVAFIPSLFFYITISL